MTLDNPFCNNHHAAMPQTSPCPPPSSEEQLLQRAAEIAGKSLASIAASLELDVPADLRHHKGWVGQLIEMCLGADATSQAEPDFRAIGVELKTIPIDKNGQPRESTYVCTVPLDSGTSTRWDDTWIRRKLSRVLWLPIEAEPSIPVARRRVGSALLWSPSEEEERLLQDDWDELMEMVTLGGLERLSARMGEVLQIRPKAANSRVSCRAIGEDGSPILSNPRGFYLRSSFTRSILERHYSA